MPDLHATIDHIFQPGKGILAADESLGSISKRFEALGIENSSETHRAYRDCLLSTAGLSDYVSGVILSDETIRQTTEDGTPFAEYATARGILPGIKVDRGLRPSPFSDTEQWTQGLDGLRERLTEYAAMGATFAKWRAVFHISETTPSLGNIQADCQSMARYAALCEEAGIVPIVETEILYNGDHAIETCYTVTEQILREMMYQLYQQGVTYETTLLKTSMVMTGKDTGTIDAPEEVAAGTIQALINTLPTNFGGVVFLSGGQSDSQAYANLNAMTRDYPGLPWGLTFSYGRALHASAMTTWNGDENNVRAAQTALLENAKSCFLAQKGQY